MHKFITTLLAGLFSTTMVGCAKVDSEDIKTSGFYTEISMSVSDNSTGITTRLRTGRSLKSDRIILSQGDYLTATMADRSIALRNEESSGYTGDFDLAIAGAEVNVALFRMNDPDAPNSTVILPEQFEITAPDLDETFNAGENITTVWTPSDSTSTVSVIYSIDCRVYDSRGLPSGAHFGRRFTTTNTGIHTASINEILNAFGNQDELIQGVSCPLEVTVERKNEGTLDSALTKGGWIKASRRKSVLVNVVP